MLGAPLTGLCHISAFMQVSSVEPPAISAYTGTGYPGTGWVLEAPHLYRQTEMMSVEQIACVTFWLDTLGLHFEHECVCVISWYDVRR